MPKTQNSRCDWSKKLFPPFQPIRSLVTRAFGNLLKFSFILFYSLSSQITMYYCDWFDLVLGLRPSIEVFLISNLFFSSFVMFLQGKLRVAVPPLTEVLLTRRRRRKCRQQQVINLIMKVSDYSYVVSQLQVVFPLYYSIPSLNFSI